MNGASPDFGSLILMALSETGSMPISIVPSFGMIAGYSSGTVAMTMAALQGTGLVDTLNENGEITLLPEPTGTIVLTDAGRLQILLAKDEGEQTPENN